MRFFFFALLLAACGDSTGGTTDDASTGTTGTTLPPTSGNETGAVNFDCGGYCMRITANCTAGLAQYSNLQTCVSTCVNFDKGEVNDISGDTLGCRHYHADAAAGDPATQCTQAGPGGDGQCGSNCEGFCTLAMRVCPTVYADEATCVTTCAGFNDTESYDAGDVAGNTLACRLYHLTVATMFPVDHCPHTAAASATCF